MLELRLHTFVVNLLIFAQREWGGSSSTSGAFTAFLHFSAIGRHPSLLSSEGKNELINKQTNVIIKIIINKIDNKT